MRLASKSSRCAFSRTCTRQPRDNYPGSLNSALTRGRIDPAQMPHLAEILWNTPRPHRKVGSVQVRCSPRSAGPVRKYPVPMLHAHSTPAVKSLTESAAILRPMLQHPLPTRGGHRDVASTVDRHKIYRLRIRMDHEINAVVKPKRYSSKSTVTRLLEGMPGWVISCGS